MTVEQALKIREFSINWINNVLKGDEKHKKELIWVIDNLIPAGIDEYDGYAVLNIENWDSGKDGGFGERLDDYFENEERDEDEDEYIETWVNDIICAIRIAVDLFIKQSGGVAGFTVGDLKKAFNGKIPDSICKEYKENLNKTDEAEGIWL